MEQEWIQCSFCNDPIMLKDAIEQEWIPYFWKRNNIFLTESFEFGPCCPVCTNKHLSIAKDGEWEVRRN